MNEIEIDNDIDSGKNDHGVKGNWSNGRFIPDCCSQCVFLDWDTPNDGWTIWYYCEKNVWFPIRTGTCKKQQINNR